MSDDHEKNSNNIPSVSDTKEITVESGVYDAKSAVLSVLSAATGVAENAYEHGAQYLKEAMDYVPDGGEYTEAVRRPFKKSPIVTALAVGAIGYLVAFLIHGGTFRSHEERVPERVEPRSKRSRRRYQGRQSGSL